VELNTSGLAFLLIYLILSIANEPPSRLSLRFKSISDINELKLSPGSLQTSKENVIILFSVLLLLKLTASATELLKMNVYTRVGTLIVATIYLQLIQNRYMFRSFTVLQCSHQHCVQPVASDVEVVGYL